MQAKSAASIKHHNQKEQTKEKVDQAKHEHSSYAKAEKHDQAKKEAAA